MAVPYRYAMTDRILRALRKAWRIPLLVLHVLINLPIALALMSPLAGHQVVGGLRLDHRALRWWSRWMMRIYGLRVHAEGEQHPGATLFVANHVSWVDIVVLLSTRMMGFVAKREIAGWPLVGWMAKQAQTIFHSRGNAGSLDDVMQEMVRRLREGRCVGAFPEGGTRGGTALGPFHARIFYAAVEAPAVVQPIALQYGPGGDAQSIIAFAPRESFAHNLWRLLGEPARDVAVLYLPVIAPGEVDGRRRIAELARERIAGALGHA